MARREENISLLKVRFPDVKFKIQGNELLAVNSKYEEKEELKKHGFHWDPQIKIWKISLDMLDKLLYASFKNQPSISIEEIKQRINNYITSINHPFLKALLEHVFEKYGVIYFIGPAAKKLHHAYKGGLAEHSLQVVENALSLSKSELYEYLKLDKELIITAGIVHDLGKLFCYKIEATGDISLTQDYFYLEHITKTISEISMIGNQVLNEILDSGSQSDIIKEESRIYFDKILHIIVSHHGILDWGSVREPQFPEAWIIHMSDNLSSKIGG